MDLPSPRESHAGGAVMAAGGLPGWTHWLALTLGMAGVLLCVLIVAGEQGVRVPGCGEAAAFFDCGHALQADPAGLGGLGRVGVIFWMVVCALLLGQGHRATGRACALVLRVALSTAVVAAWGLLVYQYSAVLKQTGHGGLCPLCLADAVLVSVVAVLVWRLPARAVGLASWPRYFCSLMAAFFGALILFAPGGLVRGTDAETSAEDFRRMLLRELDPSFLLKFGLCGFGEGTGEPQVSLDGLLSPADHIEGPAEAPVQLTVFFDPLCPGCHELGEELGRLQGLLAKTGRAGQVAVRYVPVVQRADSRHAAQALWLLRGRKDFAPLKTLIGRAKPGETGDGELAALVRRQLGEAQGGALWQRVLAGEGAPELADFSQRVRAAGITHLPAVFVDGRFLPSTPRNRQADCLLQTLVQTGRLTPDKAPSWDDCCGN
jgi:hypothetical protein